MISYPINLLLADDDNDDCLLFREALEELPLPTNLTTVNDGEHLMQLLADGTKTLPAMLFLDLNMPRKNGLECLTEIRLNKKLKDLPVIIYSTSFDSEMVKLLYNHGARFYIRKPAEFSKLKKVIGDAIMLTMENVFFRPAIENFILQP
ncbi:MAG: response regulator receiver protein [Ferruginibacter sp.]|nr:response regulator receiver protein [Ferruginibacter sp.]